MKKEIIIFSLFMATAFAIAGITVACTDSTRPASANQQVNTQPVNDIHLSGEVTPGLHQIRINDSTTILIYRGVESCTMIQLK